MSMIGNFVALRPDKLAELKDDPEAIDAFIYPEDEAAIPHHLDVDKAWHAIHFVLNGQVWGGEGPLGQAVMGGEEIGDDIGYGPARFLTPGEVRDIAHALVHLSPAQFSERFNARALHEAEIYPQIWLTEGELARDFVVDHYRLMMDFYRDAAGRGDGALLFLN